MNGNLFNIPQGVCLQVIDADQTDIYGKKLYLVIRREGREFTPLIKGTIYECKAYIDEFYSFFKDDKNEEVTDYFFALR